MIERDVAILVCSRGREEALTRLVGDLRRGFTPALDAGGLSHCVCVYAQGYAPAFLAELETRFADAVGAGELILIPPTRPHARIGDVVHAAISGMHARVSYRLAMLMDDDSIYDAHPAVDENLRTAARTFIARGHRAYSIKLGQSYALEYEPFVNLAGPIMPFKEKMMWVSREVLEEVLETPRFTELSIGEDAVIAAVAWLSRPEACFAVFGMATFLHIGFEPCAEFGGKEIDGGYAELMNYDGPPSDATTLGKYGEAIRTGVTPHHVRPDVFVGEDHPHYVYNGIREEVIERLGLRRPAQAGTP